MSKENAGKGRPRKVLSKQQILSAIDKTMSNNGASRYLHVSYPHYKKYAKLYTDHETGKSLFELHKNKSGKGIPKMFINEKGGNWKNLEKILEGKSAIYSWTPRLLKIRLIQGGYLEEVCERCKFNERRVVDFKVPLILNFKDGDKTNWRKENLGFLCYNCYFLYVEDVFTRKQIDALEDFNTGKHNEEVTWELSEEMLDHFEDLGLTEDSSDDVNEFIDYL